MVSTSSTQTATFNASQTPAVPVPVDAATGDTVYALLSYGGADTIASQPSGWTPVGTVTYTTTGSWAVVKRTMAAGVTQAQWTITTNAAGYGKSSLASIAVKNPGVETVGTVFNRSSNTTTSVLGGVTVPAGGVLLAFAGDRVSGQTSVAGPAGMTEQAKQINNLTGGTSAYIGSEFPAAGASGTRTITYGVASTNAAGILLTVAPASAGGPPTVSITPSTVTLAAGATASLSAAESNATSGLWTMEQAPPQALASPPTIAAPASASTTVPLTASGTYVFRRTSTNASGSSTADLTITVTGKTVVPVSVVTNSGGYLPVGTDTLELGLSSTIDTVYAEGAATSGQGLRTLLGPLSADTGFTFSGRFRSTIGPAPTILFRWFQGNTQIATRTQALTTAFTTYTFTLTSGEVALVTNPNDVRLDWVIQ